MRAAVIKPHPFVAVAPAALAPERLMLPEPGVEFVDAVEEPRGLSARSSDNLSIVESLVKSTLCGTGSSLPGSRSLNRMPISGLCGRLVVIDWRCSRADGAFQLSGYGGRIFGSHGALSLSDARAMVRARGSPSRPALPDFPSAQRCAIGEPSEHPRLPHSLWTSDERAGVDRSRHSEHDMIYAFDRFPIELQQCLPESATLSTARIPSSTPTMIVRIFAPRTEAETDDLVTKYFASVSLYGKKLNGSARPGSAERGAASVSASARLR